MMELIIVKKIRIRIEEKEPEKCQQRAPFHGMSCDWMKHETEMKDDRFGIESDLYYCMLYHAGITDGKRHWLCVREFGNGGINENNKT